LPWLQAHAGADPLEEIGLATARVKLEREQWELDRLKGAFVRRDAMAAAFTKFGAECRALLRAKLEAELPSAMAGMEPAQARVYGKRLVDQILARLDKLGTELWPD